MNQVRGVYNSFMTTGKQKPVNRLLGLCCVLMFIVTSPLLAQEEDDEIDYKARLVEVLKEFQMLLQEDVPEGVEDNITVAWYICSRAINDGVLRFTVDPLSKGLLQGAWFKALPGETVAHIGVSEDLLSLWLIYPSTVYAVLSSAIHEAATFFRDPPAWGKVQDSRPLEYLMLKVENYRTQAQVIKNRLLPNAYLLSTYDTYMVDSYDQDQLASVVMFFDQHSLPIAWTFYEASLKYEEDNKADVLRDILLEAGEAVLKNRNEVDEGSEDKVVYPTAISIHSWLEFTPNIIARIHNKDRAENPLSFKQILAREKDYASLYRKMEGIRSRDLPMIERMIKDTQRKFQVSEK